MHRFPTVAATLLALPLMHCAMLMPRQADPGAPGAQGAPQEAAEESSAPQTTGAGFAPSSARRPSGSGGPSGGHSSGAPQGKSAGGPSSAPIPTSVEIHSDCTKTIPVFYGEKPKFGSGLKSSVSSNSTSSATRKSDGTLTVWIIDEHENPIASAHVGPTTRRVEIDRSCTQITAR